MQKGHSWLKGHFIPSVPEQVSLGESSGLLSGVWWSAGPSCLVSVEEGCWGWGAEQDRIRLRQEILEGK